MALGNNISMGQARGKSKPILVKRRQEIVAAANFVELISSIKQASGVGLCGVSGTPNRFYHNGTGNANNLPDVGNIIYETQRATTPNSFIAGFYRMSANGVHFVALVVDALGVVTARDNCK